MRYFDYAATTPLRQEVLETYTDLLGKYFANSESMHPLGMQVHQLMEKSRQQVATLLRVNSEEIIFTSGASEANSMAIKGIALQYRHQGKHVITTPIEHSSVLHAFEQLQKEFGFEVTYLPVYEDGKIRVEDVKKALRDDTVLCSIMMVNNETGAIQPIADVKKLIKHYPHCKFHVDCVQALGKIPVDLTDIDAATFSAHKVHGLKGSGVLMKRRHIQLVPLINGGQQEFGLRGGTSNACTNIMFAKTLRIALEKQANAYRYVKTLNEYLRKELSQVEHVTINSPLDASPFVLSISCDNLPSEPHMNALANEGFCVSSVSTCGSNSLAESYVLRQMGITGNRLHGVVRISLDEEVKMEDVQALAQAIKENVKAYGI